MLQETAAAMTSLCNLQALGAAAVAEWGRWDAEGGDGNR